MDNYYEPIIRKINSWIDYDENKPKSNNSKEQDEYRQNNDLDCILTNKNLNADTIFSLWIPLRLVLVNLNDYTKLNKYEDINKKIPFLKKIRNKSILEDILPKKNEMINKLIELFVLGQERCNVMILPHRKMQSRGKSPYYDYMPYFLSECFDKGDFSEYFNGNDDLIKWINQEKLDMFFYNNIISKDNIMDLSGSGVTKNIPKNLDDLDSMLDKYISILKQRKESLDKP